MQTQGIKKAPSASVVIPHYLFGAVSFLVCSVLIVFSTDAFSGHYFHPKLLSITHLMALGWGSMIIFGALYQLLPVILDTPLYNESLAKITFGIFAAGSIYLAFSFWNFYVGIHIQIASCLILTAFILFTFNIIQTARNIPKWPIEADFIVTSTVWLLLTGIVGILMAFNFRYAFLPKSHLLFLKIHAHLGIAGWFVLLIIGVASKLIPMFLLSHQLNKKKLSYSYYFINIGLIALSADLFFYEGSRLLTIYAGSILTGILFFITYLFDAFKERARKKLDVGLKHSFLAFIIFLLPLFLGVIFSIKSSTNGETLQQVYLIYGIAIFFGFITSLILGQTFKTLPFIVWLYKYQKRAGKEKIPLPKDLYSEKLATLQFIVYIIALITTIAGVLLNRMPLARTGAVLLLLTAILYNLNVFKIVFIRTVPKS